MHTKIAHITDLHLDEAFPHNNPKIARDKLQQILKDIEDEGIQEIVCTGDIGEGESIPYFFEKLSVFDLTFTLGNHDSFDVISPYLHPNIKNHPQRLYYSVQRDIHQCIYLDSSQGVIDTVQLGWLAETIDSTCPVIIFMHHPVLGLDLKVDEIGKLQNRKEVQHLLANIPNDITIFCGHYHMENSLQYNNISQHITPAISYQIEKSKDEIIVDTQAFGYRIITIENNQISSKIRILNDANQKTIIH